MHLTYYYGYGNTPILYIGPILMHHAVKITSLYVTYTEQVAIS